MDVVETLIVMVESDWERRLPFSSKQLEKKISWEVIPRTLLNLEKYLKVKNKIPYSHSIHAMHLLRTEELDP